MRRSLPAFLAGNALGFAFMAAAHWYFWPERLLAGLVSDVTGIAIVGLTWRVTGWRRHVSTLNRSNRS